MFFFVCCVLKRLLCAELQVFGRQVCLKLCISKPIFGLLNKFFYLILYATFSGFFHLLRQILHKRIPVPTFQTNIENFVHFSIKFPRNLYSDFYFFEVFRGLCVLRQIFDICKRFPVSIFQPITMIGILFSKKLIWNVSSFKIFAIFAIFNSIFGVFCHFVDNFLTYFK